MQDRKSVKLLEGINREYIFNCVEERRLPLRIAT